MTNTNTIPLNVQMGNGVTALQCSADSEAVQLVKFHSDATGPYFCRADLVQRCLLDPSKVRLPPTRIEFLFDKIAQLQVMQVCEN